MSLLTTIIDDKSPLITYDTTWSAGRSDDNNYTDQYYLGSFQKTNAEDGTATFSFNGTAFWIYGSNRPDHGTYTVQVDNLNYPNNNGSGNNLIQQLLFSANVSQEMHTVNLINTGGTSGLYLDIDMVVWQSQVGNTGDQLAVEIVQDTDARFEYQQPAWATTSSVNNLNLNLFNNGTGHFTDSSASVSLTFTVCEVVTLFGTSGPSNGPYSVQLDGGNSVKYNALNVYPATHYEVVIYHADNLGPGTHQIVLTNLPTAPTGQYLTIDHAQLWTITNGSSTVVSASSDISQNTLSSGAIAGLVIEGVIAALAAAAAFYFYRRWKAALDTPYTPYAPLYRSPEATTAIATGIAPPLDTRNNPNSSQNDTFQPLAAVGRPNQQSDSNDTGQNRTSFHAASAPDGATAPVQLPNVGQVSSRRPLPDTPVGELPQPEGRSGFHRESELPPNYDTAVRGTDA